MRTYHSPASNSLVASNGCENRIRSPYSGLQNLSFEWFDSSYFFNLNSSTFSLISFSPGPSLSSLKRPSSPLPHTFCASVSPRYLYAWPLIQISSTILFCKFLTNLPSSLQVLSVTLLCFNFFIAIVITWN